MKIQLLNTSKWDMMGNNGNVFRIKEQHQNRL